VDTLILYNLDVKGNMPSFGTLSATQLVGFGMHEGLVISGSVQDDGIPYSDMELIEITLSPRVDDLTVTTTSEAVHILDLGDDDDVVRIKDIRGPFVVRGEDGSDEVTVSSDNSRLDQVQALLAFDGGGGIDKLIVDNTGDADVDTVLNVTCAIIEVESMSLGNAGSRAPAFSHWIDLRGAIDGAFPITLTDGTENGAVSVSERIAYPVKEMSWKNTYSWLSFQA
jgi:hypothetical protein